MASLDWQTPLSTTFGLISASFVYLLTGLYWAVSWTALNVVANAPKYVYRAASVLATPLTYPLYYIWRVIAFLLSPIWALWKLFVGIGGLLVGLIIKFKYLYIYFAVAALIGVCSACILQGTSSVLFSLLRISPSAKPASGEYQLRLQDLEYQDQGNEGAPKEEEYDDQASSSSTDFEHLLSGPGSLHREGGRSAMTSRLFEQAYRQSRSTRLSPIKPSRRFRGLLAQTIHEESSESE
ncbi:hypothetical protein SUNI508_09657 [Seiridium unicorne]|uniref:Uncharacterized protein n=1 Tax=Seiridium unicorne TaxID=138068 RepID=A0ABR2UPS4_9PEZI